MAIFRSKWPLFGKKWPLKEMNDIKIDVNRPCDISNSRIWWLWLIYTKHGVINHLWWPIWPFLDQKGAKMGKETFNIKINVNRPCGISNSRIWWPWLIYTNPGVINHFWWPIWPFLDQNGHLRDPQC